MTIIYPESNESNPHTFALFFDNKNLSKMCARDIEDKAEYTSCFCNYDYAYKRATQEFADKEALYVVDLTNKYLEEKARYCMSRVKNIRSSLRVSNIIIHMDKAVIAYDELYVPMVCNNKRYLYREYRGYSSLELVNMKIGG